MKYLKRKDIKRRNLYNKYEIKRKYLKYILYNNKLSTYIKQKAMYLLNNFPKDSSKIRIKNRCVLTNRSKSVYRDFKISRIMLRNLANNGLLAGIVKSSW